MTSSAPFSREPPGISKKPWKNRLGLAVLPLVVRLLLPPYWATCRQQRIIGRDHLERALSAGKPIIPSYWHQMHLMGLRLMRHFRRRGLRLSILVSPSGDGELAASLLGGWGIEMVRASSSSTGAQAMRDLYRQVAEDGRSPLIASDGPRGPAHEFKPGAIMLAQMTGAPILPLAYAARRSWRLGSWDGFIVPKPFSPIVWAVGELRYVPRKLTLKDIEPIQRELEATMAELIEAADSAVRESRD